MQSLAQAPRREVARLPHGCHIRLGINESLPHRASDKQRALFFSLHALVALPFLRRQRRGKLCRKGCSSGAGRAKWIGGLSEIVDSYDAFLLDLWGVVHNGSVAFPWSLETLQKLHELRKPVLFVSNSSRRRETNKAALKRLGVGPELYVDLVTSGEVAWQALAGVSGTPQVALPDSILEAKGILTFGNGSDDDEYLADLPPAVPVEEAQLLLARGCSSLCDGVQARPASWEELEVTLAKAAARRVPMLVSNPDSVRPDGTDSPMPGRLASRYIELGGPQPHFVGKPYPSVFQIATERLQEAGLPSKARLCMVGDSVWHDVRGARAAGIDVLLLCSGVHSAALGIQQAPAIPRRPSEERLAGFLGALASEERPSYVTSSLSWGSEVLQSDKRVVVCGLACIDIAQQLDTFPAPDDKVRALKTAWLGGGNAANTASALARLGTPAVLVSKVGSDALGRTILEGLQCQGVDTDFVQTSQQSSAFSTIIVDKSYGTRTCVNSPMDDEMTRAELQALLECQEQPLLTRQTQLVHLDARHPEAAVALAEACAGGEDGVFLTVDAERPRPGLEEMLRHCNGLFCSARFPEAYTGKSELLPALAKLMQVMPKANFVVATRGAKGSLLLARTPSSDLGATSFSERVLPVTVSSGEYEGFKTLECSAWEVPDEADAVLDSTGAGDVFIAGFLHAFISKRPLAFCLATGSWVATQKLKTLGARLGPDFRADDLPF